MMRFMNIESGIPNKHQTKNMWFFPFKDYSGLKIEEKYNFKEYFISFIRHALDG